MPKQSALANSYILDIVTMGKKTILYQQHQKDGAKLVDFAGWEMPLHYSSQIKEHHGVRKDSGIFDVSHMLAIDINGDSALAYLSKLLANNPQRLTPGKALYSCLLNDDAGILDDLIVYQLYEQHYRLVVNASNRIQDITWLHHQAKAFQNLTIKKRDDLSIIAIQGPNARAKSHTAFTEIQQSVIKDLKPFHCVEQDGWCIARTGYTGEDGYEVMLPHHQTEAFWQHLQGQGISACGLGARDTLRLEAGLNLHGSDMDTTTTPLESNLAWTIAWEPLTRDFIGRHILEERQQDPQRKLIGLVLEEKGRILRNHQKVITAQGDGEITSGSYSPSLECSIAFARIPWSYNESYCDVMMGTKPYRAKIIKPPFVRKGKKAFE
ncbi:MAG: glycine cleavage system aminomethyltransferase GcvT [Rickettsiella sp.]|nr:glycine cleavage system aminomethyltransferase GcvT [Rickettsiella sp.]